MGKFVFVFVLLYSCCVECQGERIPLLERVTLSILLGSITGFGCALVSACLLTLIFRYIKRLPPILKGPVVFSPQISPKSLQSALANQTLIDAPKTVLLDHNGFTIAVKKLQVPSSSSCSQNRIQRELQILGTLRHRHLMTLMAYVNTTCRLSLVYEYVPTGTLEDAIHNQLQIGWDARLRIALGIIKALHHLHFTCNPRILHYNLKPSNVFLDADFEPRLGDCGLTNTFTTTFHHHGIQSYYYAPECFPNMSMYTEKSDIFSFGVILGILLTGRDPKDPLFASGMGMWFRQVVEAGEGREALDKSLLRGDQEDEMLMAVRIAAVCLSDMPADRPSSDELVPMLTQLHSF